MAVAVLLPILIGLFLSTMERCEASASETAEPLDRNGARDLPGAERQRHEAGTNRRGQTLEGRGP
jgi:hypothetical protein